MRRRRSLLLVEPRQLEWVEDKLPAVGPDELLIETRLCAVSVGTELPHYCGNSRGVRPDRYPMMTGYENLGTVLARGQSVREVEVGDRVVAWYGHRTHAVIPATKAIVVPPDIRDEAALLTILSGDVATGIRKLGPAIGEPILVTGAGTIGLLATIILKALGAPAVDVVEPEPTRRALVGELGARHIVAPADAASLAADYGAGVECSSRDEAFNLLQDRMRHHGTICVLADGNIEPLTLAPAFHQRQLLVIGSSDCPDYHEHAHWYFPLARSIGDLLSRFFDERVSAADLPATFELMATGLLKPVKVLVQYGAE